MCVHTVFFFIFSFDVVYEEVQKVPKLVNV